jgi:hypothetical protein
MNVILAREQFSSASLRREFVDGASKRQHTGGTAAMDTAHADDVVLTEIRTDLVDGRIYLFEGNPKLGSVIISGFDPRYNLDELEFPVGQLPDLHKCCAALLEAAKRLGLVP